ncbi:hypothetical protein GJ631_14850 [Natronomonas sp. CBA1123]|uniref:hypothetical protein n=1 Tax=Natronomonas sp. CBA1123 TaxID=2668070 RepID=UPI0012EAAC57|nr:hypothetical protein [Natronomonas sp. CBA1123]MUV87794.1 hypothetical protein [Natronomonas sp. CBA1123]
MTENQSIQHNDDPPPSADEEVARLRLQLDEKSLKELVRLGLVEWDGENHVIKKGPNFDRERPLKK